MPSSAGAVAVLFIEKAGLYSLRVRPAIFILMNVQHSTAMGQVHYPHSALKHLETVLWHALRPDK